jgi:hypothetical protein
VQDGGAPAAGACATAQRAIQQRLAELDEMKQVATKTLELLGKLADLVEQPAEFNRLIARVDELRGCVQRNRRTYDLVSQVSQRAELRRLHADRAINDRKRETPERARRRLARDREYVTAFIDGCEYLLHMLPAAAQRLEARRP